VVLYGAAMPFWYLAARKLRNALSQRVVPLLSIFAAFSFVIMMFNIPLPGGTTGHAVGGAIMAIVLGPWAAVVGISVALVIQALFFGDGGITAIGANCFNMAVVLPFVAFYSYRLIAGNAPVKSPRHVIGAAVGGYLGLSAAALTTAIVFGVQPLLFTTPDGTPLYAPYGPEIAIPAIMIPHLLVASVAEALVTSLIVAYLQQANPELLHLRGDSSKSTIPLWIGLGVLAILTPLGILATGTAWGEWAADELEGLGLGFVPRGLEQISGIWSAPFPDYALESWDERLVYILSAVVGIALVVLVGYILGRWLARRNPASSGGGYGDESGGRERDGPSGNAKRRRHGFFEKTFMDLSAALESAIFAEETAAEPGLLQRLDPRIKLITTIGFLVTVALSQSIIILVIIYFLTLALAQLSRVPTAFFVKRVWVFIPFFTGIVALPALVLTPGSPLLVLLDLGPSPSVGFIPLPSQVIVTEQGVRTASFLILRVACSVSLAVLLITTTRWNTLLKALKVLRIPQIFVMVLGMTHRYIYLLLHTTNSMFLARESRRVGSLSRDENRRWLTATMSTLLMKSYRLSNEVYNAMVARGFRGEAVVADDFRLRRFDLLWSLLALTAIAAIISLDRWYL
jgi:cobalt/nickel transport system permease protein